MLICPIKRNGRTACGHPFCGMIYLKTKKALTFVRALDRYRRDGMTNFRTAFAGFEYTGVLMHIFCSRQMCI